MASSLGISRGPQHHHHTQPRTLNRLKSGLYMLQDPTSRNADLRKWTHSSPLHPNHTIPC